MLISLAPARRQHQAGSLGIHHRWQETKSTNAPRATLTSQAYRAPPYLGQHTLEVLRELGYSPAKIADLEKSGAV